MNDDLKKVILSFRGTGMENLVRNCVSLNPAYKNANLKNNEFIIRSTGDVVSQLVAPKKILNSVLFQNGLKSI